MNELTIKALEGEVIAPSDRVTVCGRPRPFGQEFVKAKLPAGLTINELIDMAMGERRSHAPVQYYVCVDGEPIPPEWRDRVRVRAGRTVTFEPRLKDSGVLRSVALIAIAVLAVVVATFLFGPAGFYGASTIGFALVSAGIGLAGSLAVNALFPIAPPKTPLSALNALSTGDSVYSIAGASNSADPFGPVPSVLGRVRVYPRYASLPYTTFSGTDQYLRMLFIVGYGPLDISDLKIGETDIDDFEDISYQIREGYEDDSSTSLYTNQAFEESLNVDMTEDSTYFLRTTAEEIDEISVDFSMPQGWYKIDDKGKYKELNVHVIAEYREYGSGGSWTNIGSLTGSIKKKKPYRFGFSKSVSRGPAYDVRVRNTSNLPDDDGFQIVDTVGWIVMRAFRNDPPIDFGKPLAVVAMKIKASGQLNGVIDNFNCIAESRINSFNGSSWDTSNPDTWDTSRNPADLIRHVLQGPAIYASVPDEQIDLDALEAFWEYCDDEEWEYNREHNFRGSVLNTMQTIASAGRGRVIRVDGKWSVIWDDADVPVAQHFTERNSWGLEEFRTYFTPPHAFRVPFVNEQKGYAADERVVYADDYDHDNATLFESIEFPGVTDPDKIWRLGRFQMAQAILRPATYTLTTNWQALSCTVGSRVYVQHSVGLWGQASGRVAAISGDTVTLDEEITFELGVEYLVRYRTIDGTSIVRSVQSPSEIGATNTFTMLSSASPDPEVGDLLSFGTDTGLPAVLMRVRDIEWLQDLTARLTLVDDAPDISDADTGDIPAFDSQITEPANLFLRAPYNLSATEQAYLSGGTIRSKALVTWAALAKEIIGFEIEMRDDNQDEPVWVALDRVDGQTLSTEEADDLEPGIYSFRVRSVFGTKAWSSWTTLNLVQMTGDIGAPDDVTGFRVSSLGDVAVLSWDEIEAPNISHYVIRQTAATEDVSWGAASILYEKIKGVTTPAPPLSGTYLIKAVTLDSVESLNPATIISQAINLRALNVVETLSPSTDSPVWNGTLTNVSVEGVSDDLVLFGTSSPMEGMYEYETGIDLGDVYTSRLSVNLTAFGDNTNNVMSSWTTLSTVTTLSGAVNADWTVQVEERHTNDDPAGSPAPEWTEWSSINISDITARAFEFRILIETLNADVDVHIDTADITVDMPDRLYPVADLSVSDTGTPHVTFDPPFKSLSLVQVTAIQDATTGDYATVSNKTASGFDIIVRNAASARVTRVVDVLAVGYGKAVS